jgi:hypothetical protein
LFKLADDHFLIGELGHQFQFAAHCCNDPLQRADMQQQTITNHPVIRQALASHQAEREAWLAAMSERLMADQRLVAAWLFGSLGRGDADALSDIDLFVVVTDGDFAYIVEHRYAFMRQIEQPLLILEAPQNWPPGGVYNMALYPGTYGPHQVDWYWVRQSGAQIPSETRLLFDRSGLPRLTSPTRFDYAPVPERPPAEIASQAVNMFWVMWLITAKYTARDPWADPFDLINSLPVSLQTVARFVEMPLAINLDEPHYPSPAAKLQRLRELAAVMEALMPQVVAKGGYIPEQIPTYAYTYLRLIEDICLG